jgi:hypothetical protein
MIMNRSFAGPAIGMAIAVLGAVACGGRAYPDASSTTTVTSANVTPGPDSVSDRIARAVCIHEVECGRVRDPGLCIDTSRSRVATELAAWTCDAESARASAEQCLSSLRSESCSVDLSARESVCSTNGGCARVETNRPAASR